MRERAAQITAPGTNSLFLLQITPWSNPFHNSHVSPFLGEAKQPFTSNILKLNLGTANLTAQKRISLSGFCSQLPRKINPPFYPNTSESWQKGRGALLYDPASFLCLFLSSPTGLWHAQQLWGGGRSGYTPWEGMTALGTALADGVDPSASHSTLSPTMTKVSADREDKVVEGTEWSVCFPTAAGENTKAERCWTWGFLIPTFPTLLWLPSPMLPSSKVGHHLPGSSARRRYWEFPIVDHIT